MADYYIKCINQDSDGDIEGVGYGSNVDKYVTDTKSKGAVISDIDDYPQKDVKTAYYSNIHEQWVEGDEVHTVNGEYIRTDGNNIESDNLENLGTCPDDI